VEKIDYFTQIVKRDLLKIDINKPDEALSEIQGFLLSIGKIIITKEKTKINFTLSSPEIARRVIKLLKIAGFNKSLKIIEKKGRKYFEIEFNILLKDLLNLKIIDENDLKVHFRPKSEEDIKSFIRGAFLGSGVVRDPKKGYYLELRFQKESSIFEIFEILKIIHFNFKDRDRKNYIILYLQDRENIKEFLLYLGTSGSYMQVLENTIIKDIRNKLTKNVNLEMKNLKKTIDSYLKAKDAIIYLKKNDLIKNLSPSLKETIDLRMKYPYLSLNELAKKMGVSKSCINHRLRRIIKLKERFMNEE